MTLAIFVNEKACKSEGEREDYIAQAAVLSTIKMADNEDKRLYNMWAYQPHSCDIFGCRSKEAFDRIVNKVEDLGLNFYSLNKSNDDSLAVIAVPFVPDEILWKLTDGAMTRKVSD